MKTEVDFAIQTAYRVFASLITKYESIFPQKKEPWYHPNDADVRK